MNELPKLVASGTPLYLPERQRELIWLETQVFDTGGMIRRNLTTFGLLNSDECTLQPLTVCIHAHEL